MTSMYTDIMMTDVIEIAAKLGYSIEPVDLGWQVMRIATGTWVTVYSVADIISYLEEAQR